MNLAKWRPLVVAVGTVLLAGCGSTVSGADGPAVPATPPTSLEEARQLWQEKGIEDYSVTAQTTCFCPQEFVQPIRLEIDGGDVVSSTGLNIPLKHFNQGDAQRLTVESLFQFVEKAQRQKAEKLEVSYDPDFGFPTFINYDGHQMIADDERQIRLTDFEPGAAR